MCCVVNTRAMSGLEVVSLVPSLLRDKSRLFSDISSGRYLSPCTTDTRGSDNSFSISGFFARHASSSACVNGMSSLFQLSPIRTNVITYAVGPFDSPMLVDLCICASEAGDFTMCRCKVVTQPEATGFPPPASVPALSHPHLRTYSRTGHRVFGRSGSRRIKNDSSTHRLLTWTGFN